MPTAIDYQDDPLEPEVDFLGNEIVESHSASYHTNEFSLAGESELRIGVRWVYDGFIDYESRNYKCRYMRLPFGDPVDLADQLKASAVEVYGEAFHYSIMEQIKIYLESPADLNIEKDWNDTPEYDTENFPFACQLVLLLALHNEDEWNSNAMRTQIQRCYDKGHDGIHIELVWHQYDDPGFIEVRLLNSAENEPRYIYPSGETRGTIIPRVIFSFRQELE